MLWDTYTHFIINFNIIWFVFFGYFVYKVKNYVFLFASNLQITRNIFAVFIKSFCTYKIIILIKWYIWTWTELIIFICQSIVRDTWTIALFWTNIKFGSREWSRVAKTYNITQIVLSGLDIKYTITLSLSLVWINPNNTSSLISEFIKYFVPITATIFKRTNSTIVCSIWTSSKHKFVDFFIVRVHNFGVIYTIYVN